MPVQTKKHWQQRLHDVVYESNTIAGKAFDITLLLLIFTSILVVMLDSVEAWHSRYGYIFNILEWVFTFLFTIEYILRLICIKKPWRYVTSFLGMVDLIAIIPSYLSVFFAGANSLLVFRSLRLLRVFRIFKLTNFISEMQFLGAAIRASLKKISIFMSIVLMLVVILGSVMYLVEGRQHGFTSIPESIYWAIVTITTVGYGDISPATPLGKLVASLIMLMGYGIIAVPTGIVTNEMVNAVRNKKLHTETCPVCGRESHDADAKYCKYCGAKL
ncbi:ion transporter [Ilyomonas limi]|uniref:Ion transporter n=1 Tax=Ilyomonas limi TaxID=2575867 RepID=A0A4V6XAY7_9BACT|nr:ion transporter [Ilyomonas limi]TKK71653.1 ion transporter [Ilyomonas limi]